MSVQFADGLNGPLNKLSKVGDLNRHREAQAGFEKKIQRLGLLYIYLIIYIYGPSWARLVELFGQIITD